MSGWHYGMRLTGSVYGGCTVPSVSREHSINMLGHVMTGTFRSSGRCTCGAYQPGLVCKDVPDGDRCDPCKELLAALAALENQSEVTLDGNTYFHAESES